MDFTPWVLQKNCITNEFVKGYPKFICDILNVRGIEENSFSTMSDIDIPFYNPYLLKGMNAAVERIVKAIDGEPILIFGDYDCDGICSTVLLYKYLEDAGADVTYYIPERNKEGYGLNEEVLNRIHDAGISLIITVDNGINSVEEVNIANELGIDVIITDHHLPENNIPQAVAVIDPHQEGCTYPFKGLCGTGVAFKLVCGIDYAIRQEDSSEELFDSYGDILSLATMADIVPLKDENRIFVKKGLSLFADNACCGLQALSEVASINLEGCTSEMIAYGLAPRINAAGRIGNTDTAVNLLMVDDYPTCLEYAQELNSLNNKRKELDDLIFEDVVAQIDENPELSSQHILVVSGRGWHFGLIGIIASKVVERYHKPAIIISTINGVSRGSARSVPDFSIIDAISSAKDCLLKYGGHKMSAGISISEDKISLFSSRINQFVEDTCERYPYSNLKIDAMASLDDLTLNNVKLLSLLEPFGADNQVPVLATMNCQLDTVNAIGNGNHLRLTFIKNGTTYSAVLFNQKLADFPFKSKDYLDIAYKLSINNFANTERVNIQIISLRPHGFDMKTKINDQELIDRLYLRHEPAQCAMSRSDLSIVYLYLKSNPLYLFGTDYLYFLLQSKLGEHAYYKTMVALRIFSELGLIEISRNGVRLVNQQGKMNLNESLCYRILAEGGFFNE